MKKGIAILFLLGFMSANMEMHQFLKVPVLIQHYEHHKGQDPSISFFEFFKMHYQGILLMDDDFAQDQQLPFQKAECGDLLNTVVDAPQLPAEMEHPILKTPKKFILLNTSEYSLPTVQKIFQPPRFS